MYSFGVNTRRGQVLVGLVALALSAFAQGPDSPLVFWTQVTLYRDEWGTPHVFGDNPRALAFGFGYAQAEDHLGPMLMAYRVANGRAAEVLGEYYAASDEFSLKMGHAELAQAALAEADPLTRDLCEGFALGVNAWIVEHPDRVPAWANGVKPVDVLALMHCYLMSMAPFDLPGVYHRPPAAYTGNAWAIAPKRTQEGEAILVINPHGYYDGPFQWYEAHLISSAMGLNVAGATLFGLPVILQGHNGVLGWALTPNKPDFADVYIEPGIQMRRNPKALNEPMFDGEQLMYMALFANTRTFHVQTPDGMTERGVPCVYTPRGPVLGRYRGRLCSYQVGGYRDFGALLQWVEMARAQTLADFQAALAMHQIPCFHVVYADRDGNIFYLYNTKVGDKCTFQPPARQSFGGGAGTFSPENEEPPGPPLYIDWTRPLAAENPEFAWGGAVPVTAMPSLLNPESGYVQACGNPPWTATADSRLDPGHWPPWLAGDRDTYRAQRVRQLLGMGQRSFRDSQSMLYDVLAPFAVGAVPRLLEAADMRPGFVAHAHPDLAVGLNLLRTWNYVAETNAHAMTFFHVWWAALHMQVPEAFASDAALYAALWENPPAMQDLALEAAAQAARTLRNEFKSPSVPWGDVHIIRRGDRQEAIAGAATGEPIFMASDHIFNNGVWPVTYGYGFAMVVEFGDRPRAVSMVPFGASEDPASPHYDDQLDLMLARRFKITRFQGGDVQRNAHSARGRFLHLQPKGMDATFTIRAPHPIEARLYTSIEPPESLPEGLATYTVYAGLEYVPRGVPVDVHMEITIPETVCALENIPRLAVYAYDSDASWYPLSMQRADPETHALIADEAGSRVYAVLGPEECRQNTGFFLLTSSFSKEEVRRQIPAKPQETLPEPRRMIIRRPPDTSVPPRQGTPGKWVQPMPWAAGPTPPLAEIEVLDTPPEVSPEPPPEPKPKPEPLRRIIRRNFNIRSKPR